MVGQAEKWGLSRSFALFFELKTHFFSKKIEKSLKIRLTKQIIRSIVLSGNQKYFWFPANRTSTSHHRRHDQEDHQQDTRYRRGFHGSGHPHPGGICTRRASRTGATAQQRYSAGRGHREPRAGDRGAAPGSGRRRPARTRRHEAGRHEGSRHGPRRGHRDRDRNGDPGVQLHPL